MQMNPRSLDHLCVGQPALLFWDSRPRPEGWTMCVTGHEAGADRSADPENKLKTHALWEVDYLWLFNLWGYQNS